MIEKIDAQTALRAFETVRQRGDKTDLGYRYNGIHAYSDFDGYTVTLETDYVRLDVFFHNKFKVDYSNRLKYDEFLATLERLAKL